MSKVALKPVIVQKRSWSERWLKLKQLRKRASQWIVASAEHLIFISAVLLIGVGIGLHDLGAGIAIAGLILLFYLYPLIEWFRDTPPR